MARLTLLQFVQRGLSAINSDNVNDIGDTVESEQMVDIVNTVCDEVWDEFPWYHRRGLTQLEASGTPAHEMRIPDTVTQITSFDQKIRYNERDVHYIEPEVMTRLLDGRDPTIDNVDSNGALDDKDPTYWTTYDDEHIIFDSYDSSLTDSLSSVQVAFARNLLTDGQQVPDFPDRLHSVILWGVFAEAFSLLLNDAGQTQRYESKYSKSKARAKRWARKINRKNSTYKYNYGRVRVTNVNRDVPSSYVQEG